MKRLVLLALWPCLASCEPSLEEVARERLAGELRDPASAQFIALERTGAGAVCGQVNARNAFGAYTGFVQFYAGESGRIFVDAPAHGLDLAESLCR